MTEECIPTPTGEEIIQEENEAPLPQEEGVPSEAPTPDPQLPPVAEAPDYAALAAADLAEIKRLDPTFAPAAHLCELPFAARFAALRDLGLSVAEALSAVTPRFSPHDNRSHLRSAFPGGARETEGLLSREELKEAKSLFSDLSEKELHALYRRVTVNE